MANHKSSLKRIRQAEKRRLENRYWAKTARNAVRKVRKMEDPAEAQAAYNKVSALLQRLGRKNVISKNKAANLCSGMQIYINKLTAAAK
ncbi:MAG: 30S ribosomal protein S20 [Muribaculaceae bacterium]|nr:30S ribosomal protein S20 [Muribaculaceae bacterium]